MQHLWVTLVTFKSKKRLHVKCASHFWYDKNVCKPICKSHFCQYGLQVAFVSSSLVNTCCSYSCGGLANVQAGVHANDRRWFKNLAIRCDLSTVFAMYIVPLQKRLLKFLIVMTAVSVAIFRVDIIGGALFPWHLDLDFGNGVVWWVTNACTTRGRWKSEIRRHKVTWGTQLGIFAKWWRNKEKMNPILEIARNIKTTNSNCFPCVVSRNVNAICPKHSYCPKTWETTAEIALRKKGSEDRTEQRCFWSPV